MLKRMYLIAWSNRVLEIDGWGDPFWLFNLLAAWCTLTAAHCDLIYEK